MNAEENYQLVMEIDANRCFLLAAYRANLQRYARLDQRVRILVGLPSGPGGVDALMRQDSKKTHVS